MNTVICNVVDNGILLVGAQNSETEYMLWQLDIDGANELHYEYNSQINGGYDQLTNVTVTPEGIHVVLNNKNICRLSFRGITKTELNKLINGLELIYERRSDILHIDNCIDMGRI